MEINLTNNAIAILSRGETLGPEFRPVLQVTDVRAVNSQTSNSGSERFRMMLSDGTHMQQGMLGTQRNDLVKNGRLQKGSLVQLNQFVCNTIQGRMIIIIIDLELILDMCELIGEPRHFTPDNANNSTPPQPRPSPQFQPSMNNQSTAHVNPQSYHRSPLSSGPHAKPTLGSSTNFCSPEMNRGAAGSFSYGNNNNNSYNSPTPTTRFPANNNPTNNMRTAQQQAYNQPPPMYSNRGPVARNEAVPCIIPIAQLNPYQGRWTIKARVTAKTELRHYNKAKGDGKVFSFDLLDSGGGEIRTTCFNTVADLFYNQIESGSVYVISKGNLKPAQKNFNHLNSEHELVLDQNSSVTLCEDDSSIPKQRFRFRLISEIEGIEINAIIDLIGVVTSISPTTCLMKKNGQETQKRVLQLMDTSGRSVELTLWGSFCNVEGQTIQQFCDSEGFVVLAVKSGRINEFNGKAVGTLSTTQFVVNPDFPVAQKLRLWYEQEGKNTASVSFSTDTASMGRTDVRKMITQIKDEKLGMSEKPDWIAVCATISFIKSDPFCYTACPNTTSDKQCSKKVVNNGDGTWRCDRCEKSFDQCDYIYILQLQLQDHTCNTWATAFQEVGEEILGISAKDLYVMKFEDQDEEGFGEILRRVLFHKYIVKLMVKEETFNDETRVKLTVKKAEKVKFASETKHLLSLLGKSSEESSFLTSKAENMTPFISNPTPSFNSTEFGNAGFRENSTPVTSMRNTASVPGSQPGQYGNNYSGGSRFVGSGTTTGGGGYLSCNSCGATGHSSMNCPSVIGGGGTGGGGFNNSGYSGGGGGGGGGPECYNCHQVGHWKRDCPNAAGSGGSGGWGGGYSGGRGGGSGGVSGECFKCHQSGHWASNCPLNNVPPVYGGGGGGSGRYDNSSRQHGGAF